APAGKPVATGATASPNATANAGGPAGQGKGAPDQTTTANPGNPSATRK
ncbi:MAG: hypothetical protein JWP49_2182, partial [Phenylobacterium sp.]|nr:hypothetical protein [Phenylobacterium sp.]